MLDLPIIAMTANASRADREACLAAGMNDHLGKPIDLQQLVATLLQWTGRGAALAPPGREAQTAGLVEGESSILARFGGNLELLRRVLHNFQPELAKQLERLHELAARGELQGVLLLLHTLKGSAGTMGASAFAARVAALEQQLKQATVEEATALLARLDWHELPVLLQQSVAALQRLFAPVAAAEPDALEPLPMEGWCSALRELCGLLERGDLQAIERAEALDRRTPTAWRQAFAPFRQAVEALDFGKALTLGRDLLNLAPGG
jgi:HPt (histidine-containing phosphotransfer) domain-containing protein